MKKVVSLVGARPQFIKEAVIGAEVRRRNAWNHILVHSGQHYDANMSDIFFSELDMKQPDYFLSVGSGLHGKQTAEVLVKFEELLLKEKPDMVLVYGDTNTTVVGDVMYDLYLKMNPRFTLEKTREQFGLGEGRYIIAILYRDLVDNPESLKHILEGLAKAKKATGLEILFPLHPRTRKRIAEFGLQDLISAFKITEPIGYLDLMSLTQQCSAVVTDSGGYQKEAYYAGKRLWWSCLIRGGENWLIIAGIYLLNTNGTIFFSLKKCLKVPEETENLYGEGNAGPKIVSFLLKEPC